MAAKKQMLIRSQVKAILTDEIKESRELMKKAKEKKVKASFEHFRLQIAFLKAILAKLNDLEVIK